MATAASVGTLRALSYRISSTPTKQLPQIAPQIASAIWNCRALLSASTDSKQSSEASIIAHKFKTQLNTLLSDRTVEGRWAAVVLTKATIEAGGVEVLGKCNVWVKSLLGILKKPDPPSTRCLVVLTLTRIFMLTWDYSNLVREITTPALKAFIPTCLANIENKRCSTAELQTVLEAFAALLPKHPTIFRENDAKLRAVLSLIISSASSPSGNAIHYTAQHKEAANRLWVLIASCTPKQGAGGKWDETLTSAVKATHSTCDRVFRSVVEDWQSTTGVQPSVPVHQLSNGEVEFESDDAAGLKPWKGVYAGGDRIISLLDIVTSHLNNATPVNVSVRVGVIADLLARLFANVLPQPGKPDFVKPNNHISKDEREAMFAVLPKIHVATMRLTTALIDRMGLHAVGWAQSLVDQLLRVFGAERAQPDIRTAAYILLDKIIDLIGPTITKTESSELTSILKTCCQDVLPDDDLSSAPATNGAQAGIKQQLGLASAQSFQTHPTLFPELKLAAQRLLVTAVTRLDSACILPKLRAQIDRTAVLTKDRDLLLASVLNPTKKPNSARVQASLLPMLARTHGQAPETDALLRPRLPPIRVANKSSYEDEMDDEVEQEEEEEDELMQEVEEQDSEPTSGLLDALAEQPAQPIPTFAYEPAVKKRRAVEGAEEADASAKRARAFPVVDAGAALVEADMPTTVVVESAPDETVQQTSILPAREIAPSVSAFAGQADDDDSDSDAEMPVINMEESDDE